MHLANRSTLSVFALAFILCLDAKAIDLRSVFELNRADLDQLVKSMATDGINYVSCEKAIRRKEVKLPRDRARYYCELLKRLGLEEFGNVMGPPYYATYCMADDEDGGIQLGLAYGDVPKEQVVRSFADSGETNVPQYTNLEGKWYIYVFRHRNPLHSVSG